MLPDLLTLIYIQRDNATSPAAPIQPRFWPLWLSKNPRLRLRSLGTSSAAALIHTKYSSFSSTYAALMQPVEQSDFARYLAIYHSGGFYADGDVVPILPTDRWPGTFGWRWASAGSGASAGSSLLRDVMIVGVEDTRPLRIAQFVFASVPKHPLLLAVAEEVQARVWRIVSRRASVVERTGPLAWTDAIVSYIRRHGPPVLASLNETSLRAFLIEEQKAGSSHCMGGAGNCLFFRTVHSASTARTTTT
eukprot:CAMPEP_0181219878 /NCGR_PEP_ID=MMETSP1096-20121128/28527_1 /TAXON_ID=156174 ORGANISM="Chrysochromulina ericina, Strain CCMP281" /NCGR_SAMPLE_ID=MMETSP1096 /ASSEMBLY_ACC=CAM_ASM_000453 /LENGTH=247 /DNA_ID=CAMNT_0023312321 /DNA_START=95 /DNA_END=842 /DNA_ORIENTATION=+